MFGFIVTESAKETAKFIGVVAAGTAAGVAAGMGGYLVGVGVGSRLMRPAYVVTDAIMTPVENVVAGLFRRDKDKLDGSKKARPAAKELGGLPAGNVDLNKLRDFVATASEEELRAALAMLHTGGANGSARHSDPLAASPV